ncbi:peptidyl-alpha-hydroxyglycine alpha-amidating lyase family protein [Phenylobacterium sp.]|uniref:peptidyl-alpha-hydroxyglycine alpha-amidating lyase family protein n=1 Tax=Phenylobacterium sp. TaxID=1871053 RepID=UPI003BACD66C
MTIRMGLALIGAIALLAVAPARAQTPSAYRVVHGWPVLPEGRILGSAAGVGVNSKGEVLVFHRAGRTWSEPLPLDAIKAPTVAVFDAATGRFLREWGAGAFAMPHGLSVDAQDNVWLTDVALQQVFKFSPDGTLLMTLGERGVAGADAGHFNRPTDVAVLPDGSFLVSDGYRNTRVAKFAADGRFLSQWGRPGRGEGQFNTPHAIAVDAKGQVYVADRQNDRVQVFDGEGRFLRQLKGPEAGRPHSVAVLADGGVAIADGGEQPASGPDRSGVAILDAEGRVRQRLGRFGNQDGQFRMAHDLAVDANGALYVVDIIGQRVQKFEPAR